MGSFRSVEEVCAAARQAIQAFLDFWKNADPDLVPLKDARELSARLQ